MKKNGVSVDFVAFGDLDPDNTKKLEVFQENVNSGEGSHLAIFPPGPHLLSDQLRQTPILGSDGSGTRDGDGGTGGGADAGGGDDFPYGVDPSADPELALALRMSMEEEKARQDKEAKAKSEAAKESGLEGIPEEGGESQPLLDQNGEASGSGNAAATEEKDKDKNPDKMDTE